MVLDYEQIVQRAFQIAEEKNLKGWVRPSTATPKEAQRL
jgi:hypothetical protein